jgi:hypothetical protein
MGDGEAKLLTRGSLLARGWWDLLMGSSTVINMLGGDAVARHHPDVAVLQRKLAMRRRGGGEK